MKKGFPSKKEVQEYRNHSKAHHSSQKSQHDEISPEEHQEILEKSYDTVKTLNQQVEHVQNAKKQLEEKVHSLTKKVEQNEKSPSPESHPSFLEKIKEEIFDEITPFLEKTDSSSFHVSIKDEIYSFLQDEFEKLRAEMSSSQKKLQRSFSQTLSDLEVRLVEGLKDQAKLKQQISNQDSTQFSDVYNQIEETIEKKIETLKSQLHDEQIQQRKELEDLDESFVNHKQKTDDILKELKKAKESFDHALKNSQTNIGVLQSKVATLEKHFDTIDSLNTSIEEKQQQYIQDTLTREFAEFKQNADSVLKQKQQDLSKEVKEFEKRLTDFENQNVDQISYHVDKVLNKSLKSYYSDFESFIKQSQKDVAKEISDITKQAKSIEKSFTKFKQEVEKTSNKLHQWVEQQINQVQSDLEKEKIARREFSSSQIKEMKNLLTDFQNFKDETNQSIEEKGSNQIIKVKEFITSSSKEIEDALSSIREDIENKVNSLEVSFKETFEKHLSQFEEEFSQQQTNYVSKITSFDDQKDQLFADIENFKESIESEILSLKQNLEEKDKEVQSNKISFDEEQKQFQEQLDDLTYKKRNELQQTYEELREEFDILLQSYKSSLLSQEDTFRQVFTEKINSLWDHIDTKLNSIDKKFIQKHTPEIEQFFEKQKEELKDYENSITKEANRIELKLSENEKKELEFFQELHNEQENVQKRVEERITLLEKQLNKRFLDEKSDLSDVKSIVIDEVEGLIRDVDETINHRMQKLHEHEERLKKVLTQATAEFKDIYSLKQSVEAQLRDVRDEISDIKVRKGGDSKRSLQSFVETMNDYEQQLNGLISNLLSKGFTSSHIEEVLVSKGHPRGYISVLLSNISVKHRE